MTAQFNQGEYTQELESRLESFNAIKNFIAPKGVQSRIKIDHINEATENLTLSDDDKKELFRSIGLDSFFFHMDKVIQSQDYIRRGKVDDDNSFIGVVNASIKKIEGLLEWLSGNADAKLGELKKFFEADTSTRHLTHTTGLAKYLPKAALDAETFQSLSAKSYPMKISGIGDHIVKGLEYLQEKIADAKIPAKTLDGGINIAEWNIRAFGEGRDEASLYYIAEIIRRFDLIGITEIKTQTGDLKKVMEILGDNYQVIYSDSDADSAGNSERIGYIYDKRSIKPTSEIGEIRTQFNAKKDGKYLPSDIFWRNPYKMTFTTTSSDLPFTAISAHIRYQDEKQRIQPIFEIADHVYDGMRDGSIELPIVMGDFNIPNERLLNVLLSKGLVAAQSLYRDGKHLNTNLIGDKPYDTIATTDIINKHLVDKDVGGVVNFGRFEDSAPSLYSHITDLSEKKYTFEMSDHLPVWTRLNINKFNNGMIGVLAAQTN